MHVTECLPHTLPKTWVDFPQMETGFVHLFKIFRLISCNEIGSGEYFGYKYLGCTQNSPESPKTGRCTAHIMNPPTERQLQRGKRGIFRYCLPASFHRNLPAAPHQDNSLWLLHLKELWKKGT